MAVIENLRRPGTGPAVVYEGLRRQIAEHVLQPDTRLPEDTIAVQFGVSRTVVRSALDRLAAEGLITRPNNRGARVASPSVEEGVDLFELRVVVESLVMRRLAGALSDESVQHLMTHIECERAARDSNPAEAVRLAGEFHILLAELTGSAALMRSVRDLVSRCSLVLAGARRLNTSDCATDGHLDLVHKLRTEPVRAVCAAMTKHLLAELSRASPP